METSNVLRFLPPSPLDAVKRSGAHRIIFGSDVPWLHPGVALTKVLELPISDTARSKITGKNFLSLINGGRPLQGNNSRLA